MTVDDHPVVREGIGGLIGIPADMVLAGEAANGRERIQQYRTYHPDATLSQEEWSKAIFSDRSTLRS